MSEWTKTNNLYELFCLLKKEGIMNRELWRLFHCECCRAIWENLDATMRLTVDVAEHYTRGLLPVADLHVAFEKAAALENDAWSVVQSMREQGNSAEWIWPLSEAVDEAWVRYCAAGAAKTCALDASDEILFTTIPDSAACVLAWLNARHDVLQANPRGEVVDLRDLVLQRWEQIRVAEEEKQTMILRDLVEKYRQIP